MTPKQQRFIQEYALNPNATEAAIKAGYSEKTASEMGYENLNKPQIKAAIKELLDKDLTKVGMTRERVMQEYARLGTFDVRKLYDAEGKMIPIHKLDDDTAAAIGGVDIAYNGEKTVTTKIKVSDKKAALDSVAKIHGMFVEKHEHSGPDGQPIETISSNDAAMRIAFALEQAARNTGDK